MAEEISIRQLAKEFAVTTRTLRFYEDQGLLMPERRGQHRIFIQRDRVRLKLILRGKRLGFKLYEIRDLIDMYGAEQGEEGQLHSFIAKISERKQDLLQKKADIEEILLELEKATIGCQQRLGELNKNSEVK